MPITESIFVDEMHRAMKARDMTRVYVMRGVLSAIRNAKIEKRVTELPEPEVAGLLRREVKKRDEAVEFARQGGRADLVAQNEAERAILAVYLPAVLTPAETEDAVRRVCAAGAVSIGDVMSALRAEYGARLDAKRASEAARRVLAERG
jgi:uncharacterized protein YqeY